MKQRTSRWFYIALALALASMALSCRAKTAEPLSFEETPLVSGGLGWAVVSIAYARLLTEPRDGASDSATARRGDVARIVARERSLAPKKGVWYRLELGSEMGWLREESLTVYRSEAEARKAARVEP